MDILQLLLFLLPCYVANSVPVVLGGGTPLDLGRKMSDGERIFGDGKTVRGFVAGVAGGTLASGIIAVVYSLSFFSTAQMQFTGGVAMALGTMCGDALGSFVKRRIKYERGKPFFPDTFLFAVFALAFAYPFAVKPAYEPAAIAFFLGLTIIVHPLFNVLANRAGLKKVPW